MKKQTVTIDIEVPEGYEIIDYNYPKEGEAYIRSDLDKVVKANFDYQYDKFFIVEQSILDTPKGFEYVKTAVPEVGEYYVSAHHEGVVVKCSNPYVVKEDRVIISPIDNYYNFGFSSTGELLLVNRELFNKDAFVGSKGVSLTVNASNFETLCKSVRNIEDNIGNELTYTVLDSILRQLFKICKSKLLSKYRAPKKCSD